MDASSSAASWESLPHGAEFEDVGSDSDGEVDHDIIIADLVHRRSERDAEVELSAMDPDADDDVPDDENVLATGDTEVTEDTEYPEFYKPGTYDAEKNPACWPDMFKKADGTYQQPSGARYVAGSGDKREFDAGGKAGQTAIHYSKTVETGLEGRKGATHEDPCPSSRSSKLNIETLKDQGKGRLGFKPSKHLQSPLWFLFLLMPVCDIDLGGGKSLMGFFRSVRKWTAVYASELDWGGDWSRQYDHKRRQLTGIVRWFGVCLMDAILGSNGDIQSRFDKHSLRYSPHIANAFTGGYREWQQTKSAIKLNDNHRDSNPAADPTNAERYNPAFKFHRIYACNQHNTVNLLQRAPLDLTADESTWSFHGWGEPGSNLVRNLRGKKTGRGGQVVLVMESTKGRHRLIAFLHRHKKHHRLHTAGGPNESMHIIEMLKRMTKGQREDKDANGEERKRYACHDGLAFPELYDENHMWHLTCDNYFFAVEVAKAIQAIPGAGWLSTVPRLRVLWKEHQVHRAKKAVSVKNKIARFCNAIVCIVWGTAIFVSMQSTGTTNFCCIRSGTFDGIFKNFTKLKTRGRNKAYKWLIESNTFRQLYLATYNAIDVVDRYVVHGLGMKLFGRKYWHSALLHGFGIAVTCAFSLYEEVYDRTTPAEAGFADEGEMKKKKMTFTQFREKLAVQMLAYDSSECLYPGEETLEEHKQTPRARRVGRAAVAGDESDGGAGSVDGDGAAIDVEGDGGGGEEEESESEEDDGDEKKLKRFLCYNLSDYVQKHGVNKLVKTKRVCAVCGCMTNHMCKACNAPLCVMSLDKRVAQKDCHARYHDPDFVGLAYCDSKNKRKYEGPSDYKVDMHAKRLRTERQGQ